MPKKVYNHEDVGVTQDDDGYNLEEEKEVDGDLEEDESGEVGDEEDEDEEDLE